MIHRDDPSAPIRAQARLLHAYLLGLQLMVSTRRGPEVMGEWMFRLFRRQHREKFLSSLDKLGLSGLPDAVACARYHVMSNSIGGVPVEYLEESDRKAWVRFRYPRWMYEGPTICGIPVEVSRGFLRGWYAHNGVSLNNPRLAFVCVSEDMTDEFGLCGYFMEFDRDLAEDERLQLRKGERPPRFDPGARPALLDPGWSRERLEKANRNYAMEYVRNGLCELAAAIGEPPARELGRLAATLIGLQYYAETATLVGAVDGDAGDAAGYLAAMLAGMGDWAEPAAERDGRRATVRQTGLRIVRGLDDLERALVLHCWQGLWIGALRSHRVLKRTEVEPVADGLLWRIEDV